MAKKQKAKRTPKVDGAPVDLAEKKKHVRELAKTARWKEIKRLYGEKMVAKAKAYVEKNQAKHTPRSLAQEILAKNGYEAPSPLKKTKEITEVATPKTPVVAMPKASEAVVSNTPMVAAPVVIECSPDTITEAQRQQIENRRQQAVERRKQKLAMLSAQKSPSYTIDYGHDVHHSVAGSAVQECHRLTKLQQQAGGQYSSITHKEQKQQQHIMMSRGSATQRATKIPDYITAVQQTPPRPQALKPVPNQKQHSLFLDDLEAAVDIVKWEEDQQVAQACVHEVSPEEYTGADRAAQWEAQQTERSTSFDHYNTILDELDAAADIVQWETEQADASAMGRNHFSISDELAVAAEIVDWDFDHQNVVGANGEWCIEASSERSKCDANLLHMSTGDAESTGSSSSQPSVGKTNGNWCSKASTDGAKLHGTSSSVPEIAALVETGKFISWETSN